MTTDALPVGLEPARALIGAALLDREAAAIASTVPRGDWPTERLAVIADAIRVVLGSGDTPDVLLVSDTARETGVDVSLTELRQLFVDTPSVTNAGRYAELVRRDARWRRLAHLGDALIDAALRGDEDAVGRTVERIGAEVAA
jgi:replicative DNA helicase